MFNMKDCKGRAFSNDGGVNLAFHFVNYGMLNSSIMRYVTMEFLRAP